MSSLEDILGISYVEEKVFGSLRRSEMVKFVAFWSDKKPLLSSSSFKIHNLTPKLALTRRWLLKNRFIRQIYGISG